MNRSSLPDSSSLDSASALSAAVPTGTRFASPPYETEVTAEGLRIIVYLPEVDPRAVEIITSDGDLTLTAPRRHYVRPNWSALHLESVQRDYRLHIRLGTGLDLENLVARYRAGRIVLEVPKRTLAPRPERTGGNDDTFATAA